MKAFRKLSAFYYEKNKKGAELIMDNSKVHRSETYIACDISEVNIFPNNYVAKISGENRLLEGFTNEVLQSDEIPKDLKNKLIGKIGTAWFKKFPDSTYIWKGL